MAAKSLFRRIPRAVGGLALSLCLAFLALAGAQGPAEPSPGAGISPPEADGGSGAETPDIQEIVRRFAEKEKEFK
ncbi:MAG: hypothetical protein HYS38_04485, partial [Acidobacteria bacterium]|nr:hypothetical protein [Acidobacteriota bacterium]